MTVEWRDVAPDFAPDGSLRDVYVLETGLRGWDAVLALVRAEYAPLRFTVDGAPAPVPWCAADAFAIREQEFFEVGDAERAAPRVSF